MQQEIREMIHERAGASEKGINHEARGLKRPVEASACSQEGIGRECQLDVRQMTNEEMPILEDIRVIKANEIKTQHPDIHCYDREHDVERRKTEPGRHSGEFRRRC